MSRLLLHYFLIGGLLFGAKSLFKPSAGQGPALTVSVPRDATEVEVDRRIREAILLHEARRYGWDRTDPVVFSHLVRNMRFIEPDSPDDDLTLYERAIAMNMQAHDPVVRARLLYRANEALRTIPDSDMPTRDELERHRQAHPERFRREARFRVQHVFLSRSKRGAALSADATAMRTQLAELSDRAPDGVGDPLPGLRSEQVTTPSKLSADYGDEVADAVSDGVAGVWRGPIASVYGLHFIKVVGEEPAYVPPLDVISAEVRADRLRELQSELADARMAALRRAYRVRVEQQL